MRLRLIGGVLAIASLLIVSGVALADHQWSNFHWPTDNAAIRATGSTTSPVFDESEGNDASIDFQVGLWNAALGKANSSYSLTLLDGVDVDIDVGINEGKLRGNWIGVASVLVETSTGHILEGEVTLNTFHFANLSNDQWAHVACQEIGHILGLDHDTANDSCVSTSNLGEGDRTTLGAHDIVELAAIYGSHVEGTPTPTPTPSPDDDGVPGVCKKNPNHHHCPRAAGQGTQWVTVHVFPAP